MKLPSNLVPGDRIAIIPPAKAIEPHFIQDAVKLLESWELNVVLSDNINSKFHQFAGSDLDRSRAFQKILDSSEIKCILCARGGYGTTRIIEDLNFEKFLESPKWIVGYSDITALLLHLNRMGISGIHGPMPINFHESGAEESLNRLRHLLFNGYLTPIHFLGTPNNRQGFASGRLIGGNLSMLVNCMGTSDDFSTDGRILFLEDIDEYLYRIDRMLVQLKRSGKLQNLSGLIIGQFTNLQDNDEPFGSGVEEMILRLTSGYDFPLCFNAPVGHEMPNFPLPVGQNFDLDVGKQSVVLKQSKY